MPCSNCNDCNCGNCCSPTPPPLPPTPPTCSGTSCEEFYDAKCVLYTGPAIPCLGITAGMSLNDYIQIIANRLCLFL